MQIKYQSTNLLLFNDDISILKNFLFKLDADEFYYWSCGVMFNNQILLRKTKIIKKLSEEKIMI